MAQGVSKPVIPDPIALEQEIVELMHRHSRSRDRLIREALHRTIDAKLDQLALLRETLRSKSGLTRH